ncbi:glycoside hydrolase family 97 catalytic domain-containing protein [Halogeometricum sp. S1BR25-6]|uniref:Glycoside hydrolase family 97 catalytic domain-containing protein n=1 Tax=Halogeometricum salsisoli TaxID=2950536 RepID=A0ABU2GIW8_9EURY|nr:glycoside hydrolase family 97 catalytic domain-containing protein [Halogeometricum sp. S1BR25-6]MDS0300772.1 glycoside hydrolase family 97 catalytic domain-containing protein [Halogeometricum sp. S1BR25-6]
MFDELNNRSSSDLRRREFVGGIASLAAASAFSVSVSESAAAQVEEGDDEPGQTLASPDGSVEISVDVTDGVPSYSVSREGTKAVEESTLGFEFEDQAPFREGVEVTGTERSSVDERWTPVWDQYDEIPERYEQLRIGLRETAEPNRSLTLELRAFDDGVGFRYVFPAESGFGDFAIAAERTEFAFADDHTSWWIENNFNSYEYAYEETPLSDIGELSSFGGAHTPLTMKASEDLYLSVHEANLVDYAAMAVEPTANGGGTTFESVLAPLPDGTKVTASAPHRTPWRTVQLASRPGELVESNLVLNLNEPFDPELFPKGTDWIEPGKFVGIWWLMITGRADWEYQGPETGNHGAQTGRMKRYMDFASEHGIRSVLVEGWNEGWDSYPGEGSTMDFDDSYPDFDWQAVTDYGLNLDPPVEMTAHNETAGNVSNYESQLENSPNPFADYEEKGIRSIKTGYVADSGVTIDGTTYNHHCQPLVNHHHLVYREAAKHRQMLEVHEPIKPTGERRTYPNVMTREGVLGQEYDSFGYVSPDHHVTFPFTRMLGGPVEYTPGIFDMDSGSGGIETTRAKQLAMYPTYLSGLQMVADLPSSYLAEQDATLGVAEQSSAARRTQSGDVGDVAQAEFGDRDGLSRAARWANAQGGRYVPFDPNAADSGASVSWTVEDVPAAGEYDVHLRYASDAEENAVAADTPRTATVVAGDSSTRVTLPPTAYWDEWATTTAALSFDEGESDLSVTLGEDDTGGFNLDAVAVTESGAAMPTPEADPTLGPTVPEFEFVEDVPAAGWDDTTVLDSEIGEYTLTARRKGEEWYVGAMTGSDGRALDVPLDFLAPGESGDAPGKSGDAPGNRGNGNSNGAPRGPKYVAEMYSDAADAAYDSNLDDVRVDEFLVDPSATVLASMVESGGTALRLRPPEDGEAGDLPRYERPEQDVDVTIAPETFVESTFVTATGSNAGDYVGGTTVEVVVDGEVASTSNVRFPPNSSEQSYAFSFTIDDAGTYDVAVRTPDGNVLARRTVTVKPPVEVASFADPPGDDVGPGEYVYPTNEAFEDGAFDLRSFVVSRTSDAYQFTFAVENLYNAFGSSRGFSPQMFVLWVRDPSADGGRTDSLDDLGANATFEAPWHYRVEISGFTKSVVDASGTPLTSDDGSAVTPAESVDAEAGTVTLTLPRDAFDGVDAAELEVVAMVQSEDRGSLRPVAETAEGYVFGGATAGAVEQAPLVMDLVTDADVDQSAALSYSSEERATLPYVSLDGSESGDESETETENGESD